jgi:hypothetical protein
VKRSETSKRVCEVRTASDLKDLMDVGSRQSSLVRRCESVPPLGISPQPDTRSFWHHAPGGLNRTVRLSTTVV